MKTDQPYLYFLTISELSKLIRGRHISPVELVEAHLSRIESLQPSLNSFITIISDQAMISAKRSEKELMTGTYRGPLHGIPFGLKDLFEVAGVRNTNGSKIFDEYIPSFDSTVATKLKDAGAILLGKLNMQQFAYGPNGENTDYGHMHNPWNLELISGGSSGGSGSSTAAGECAFTMGTDTGGSVRIPSALCGIVGLKPTYGRVSLSGVTPLAWSLDHAGPMCRTVQDCRTILNVISERKPRSARSVPEKTGGVANNIKRGVRGLKIGVPREYFELPIDPDVKHQVQKAIDMLTVLGANVVDISWPLFHYSASISTAILMAEASEFYKKLIIRHGPNMNLPERLRLEAGLFISGVDYVKAQRARVLFTRESHKIFEEVDLLVGPTTPMTAYPIGSRSVRLGKKSIGSIAALTQYTRAFNLNGFPAISIPCGFSEQGLPIGLQLAGKPYYENAILRTAYAYEQSTDWHNSRPPI